MLSQYSVVWEILRKSTTFQQLQNSGTSSAGEVCESMTGGEQQDHESSETAGSHDNLVYPKIIKEQWSLPVCWLYDNFDIKSQDMVNKK